MFIESKAQAFLCLALRHLHLHQLPRLPIRQSRPTELFHRFPGIMARPFYHLLSRVDHHLAALTNIVRTRITPIVLIVNNHP